MSLRVEEHFVNLGAPIDDDVVEVLQPDETMPGEFCERAGRCVEASANLSEQRLNRWLPAHQVVDGDAIKPSELAECADSRQAVVLRVCQCWQSYSSP